MSTEKQKVTIYHGGIMGVHAIEAKLIDHGRRKYAQYPAAPFVEFIEKRKRKAKRLCNGSSMGLLIVEGWNQPAPQSMFDPATSEDRGNGLTCTSMRYSACDPRWQSDFDTMIAGEDVKVIADYRDNPGV